MSTGIVRYLEIDGYGRNLARTLYIFEGGEIPKPLHGTTWQIDANFDRAAALVETPSLAGVFKTVLKGGMCIVTGT